MNSSTPELSEWCSQPAAFPSPVHEEAARLHQAQLTKPRGALGDLEDIVVRLAALQSTKWPAVDMVGITVFAADHGVTIENVSPFPQAVTVEMVRNFAGGGAAISVLARELAANLTVVNVGTVSDPGHLPGVLDQRVMPGTANLAVDRAMTPTQCQAALDVGKASADRAADTGVQLYIGGEMGIGNTTSASALGALLLDHPASDLTGPGTGLDRDGVFHKTQVIERALQRHADACGNVFASLCAVGGLEIAALTGAYLRCAQRGVPVLVDGFIASVAALTAARLRPDAVAWFLFAHESPEPGHRLILQSLDADPLLSLRMRLGEGSGAAVALPLLRLACRLHRDMATFLDAKVSNRLE